MSAPRKLSRREAALVAAATRRERERLFATHRVIVTTSGRTLIDVSLAAAREFAVLQGVATADGHTRLELANPLGQ